jgi:NADH-quinone oxidoreductase subunit N
VANAVGADNISDFNGLGRRSPFLAACLTLAVLSMAGLPFTAGFFAKFFLFQAAVAAGLIPLVIIGAGAVACGFYYYLKVVRAMYWMPSPGDGTELAACRFSWPVGVLMAVLALLTLILGVYPTPVFALFY